MPNKWTFTIKPIRKLVMMYVRDGVGWIDPFAGMHSPAEFRNDLNPNANAEYSMNAVDFCKNAEGKFKGVIFDPPYSLEQTKRLYKSYGLVFIYEDTLDKSFDRVKDQIYRKIKSGGYAISCGWSSTGFGKKRGFRIVEILLVSHGGNHNDTIVTVEKKITQSLSDFSNNLNTQECRIRKGIHKKIR